MIPTPHISELRSESRRFVRLPAIPFSAILAAIFWLFLMATAWAAPVPQASNALQVYFVDVEGGQATLLVTPARQSLLIDTGWPGNNGLWQLHFPEEGGAAHNVAPEFIANPDGPDAAKYLD
jgi:hypothetical protein